MTGVLFVSLSEMHTAKMWTVSNKCATANISAHTTVPDVTLHVTDKGLWCTSGTKQQRFWHPRTTVCSVKVPDNCHNSLMKVQTFLLSFNGETPCFSLYSLCALRQSAVKSPSAPAASFSVFGFVLLKLNLLSLF